MPLTPRTQLDRTRSRCPRRRSFSQGSTHALAPPLLGWTGCRHALLSQISTTQSARAPDTVLHVLDAVLSILAFTAAALAVNRDRERCECRTDTLAGHG